MMSASRASGMSAMSQKDEDKFGDRCPLGYKKEIQLGKGGTSIVWLAMSYLLGIQVAMK